MNQRDVETLLIHQSLARMSDTPNPGLRSRQLEKRLGNQIHQAWRQQRFGNGSDLDPMSCPF
jgi:hypothetical protein